MPQAHLPASPLPRPRAPSRRLWPMAVLALPLLYALSAAAQSADLQPATGGGALPPEGGGEYTELDGPVVTESGTGQIGEGQIILELPSEFEYDTANPPEMCLTDGDNAAGQNINQKSVGDCRVADSITAQQAVFNINRASRRDPNQLSFSGLQVRPVDGAEDAEGDITQTGSSNISGINDPSVSWGELAQLPPGEDIILTANDEPDEVIVNVDQEVDFEVFAQNCPDEDGWRNNWIFGDGEEEEEIFVDPPCGFEVSNSHTYTEIGVYEAEFISEYCTDWSGFTCTGSWEEFGRDQVTVIVEPPESDANTLIEYRFEENEWTGAGGEVEDDSGNAFDGTSFGGAQTTDDDPAIDEDPGTCRYGEFAPDGRIEAPLPDALNDTESFAVGFWLRMSDQSATTPSIIAVGDLDGAYAERFEILQRSNGNLQAVFRTEGGDEFLEAPGGEGVDDGWVHVTVVRDYYFDGNRPQADHRFYIDANLVAEENLDYPPGQSDDSLLLDADSPIQIAGYASGDFPLAGDLDEINLFEGALDDAEVEVLRDRVFPCQPEVAYYRVTHTGQGITCATTPVTVEARDDDDEPVEPQAGTVVNLFSDTGNGFWSTLEDGSGTFESGADGDANYTFPGDETRFTAGYDYPGIETDPEAVTPQAEDQDGIDSVSDTLEISRAGFRFIDQGTGSAVIPDQVAGRPSDTDDGAADLALQAIRESDDDPQTCDGVYEDGETAVIELAAECRNPNQCAGAEFLINGVSIATVDDNADSSGASDYESVALDFGPDSSAPIVLEYPDAGAMRLYAQAEIERGDDEPSGEFMTGASNEAVWRPFGFHVDVSDDPGETPDPGGSVLATAGADFEVALRAVAWQPGQDADGDGVPDPDADLSGNPSTPNFGNENDPVSATLSAEVAAPAQGNDGALQNEQFENFSAGEESRSDVRWTEVGYVDLTAELDDSYLGSETFEGIAQDIGRFTPDRYLVTDIPGELAAACTENAPFNYLTRAMAHDPSPEVTVEAVNVEGNRTRNAHDYTPDGGDNWWRFDDLSSYDDNAGTDDFAYHDEGIPEDNEDDLAIDAGGVTMASQITEDVNEGVGTIVFGGELGHRWDNDNSDPAPNVAPFESELQVDIRIRDLDDVEYEDGEGDDANRYELSLLVEDDAEQRHGRLELRNAHGSELLDLAVPTRVQYFRGEEDGWGRHGADTCTDGVTLALSARAGAIQPDDTCAIEEGDDSGIGCEEGESGRNWTEPPEEEGDFNLWLREPGEGATGALELSVSDQPYYLDHDWSRDGEHDESDSAEITFGIFEGNPRQIDRREVR